jgi:hypothetical protein
MFYADFDTRQQLAREHRDELARDYRLAQRIRPDGEAPIATRSALGRVHDQIRVLTKLKSSNVQRPQEV